MRRLFLLAALTLSACATTPTAPPPAAPVVPAAPPVRTGLSGLTQAEMVQRFGAASFQVREGSALKLQWKNATCVLDTYLYPPASGGGAASVLHADARRPGSGDAYPVESCVAALTVVPAKAGTSGG